MKGMFTHRGSRLLRGSVLVGLVAMAACADDAPADEAVDASDLADAGAVADGALPTPDGGAWIDPSFGAGGFVTLDGLGGATATALALDPDGRLYVGGAHGDVQGPLRTSNTSPFVCRVTPDGILDPTFGAQGCVTGIDEVGWSGLHDLLVDDQHVTVVGAQRDAAALWQFDLAGHPNLDFGEQGRLLIDVAPGWSAWAERALPAPTGGFVIAGKRAKSGSDPGAAIAATVSVNGAVVGGPLDVFEDTGYPRVAGFHRRSDGRYWLAGSRYDSTNGSSGMLFRLDATLAPDSTWTAGFKADAEYFWTALAPDDGLYAIAFTPRDGVVLRRLTADGQLDPGFAGGQTVELPASVSRLFLLPDGRLAITGVAGQQPASLRLADASGYFDPRLGPDGYLPIDNTTFKEDRFVDGAVDGQGRLILAATGKLPFPGGYDQRVYLTRVILPKP
jgi:uncharacterized delta-60 repeat protein